MQTKRKLILAMFASSLMAGAAYAQDAGAQAGTTGAASGAIKMDSENSAKPLAPGQQQKEGSIDSAAEAAPGQQMKDGTVDSASEAAPGQMKPQDEASDETGPDVSDETTASIDLSTEQRTEVKQVFTTQSVEPVDIDFDLSVGVAVPRTVTLHPVPPRIVEIVPAYEGYEYFVLADGRIVIVEPGTLHVVYILV